MPTGTGVYTVAPFSQVSVVHSLLSSSGVQPPVPPVPPAPAIPPVPPDEADVVEIVPPPSAPEPPVPDDDVEVVVAADCSPSQPNWLNTAPTTTQQ